MDTEDRPTGRRIAAATITGTLGSALLVATVVRLLQVTQEILPWWWPWPIIFGSILFIFALFLLVPPRFWRRLRYSILGLRKWLRETCIWYRYGPKCTLKMPVIDFELSTDEQQRRYSAKVLLIVSLTEKAKNYYPVRCSFRSMTFQLKQKHGMMPLSASLELNPLLGTEILISSPGETTHWIGLSWFPYNNPAIPSIDLQKPYTWIIKDVRIHLGNLQKHRKLSRKGRVANAKKT